MMRIADTTNANEVIPPLLLDKQDKRKNYLVEVAALFVRQLSIAGDRLAAEDYRLVSETITVLEYTYVLLNNFKWKHYDDIPEHYRFDHPLDMIHEYTHEQIEWSGTLPLSLAIVGAVRQQLDDIIHQYHNVRLAKVPFWKRWFM